jgi:hypothetical protein
VRYSAFYFKFQYRLLAWRAPSSCLRLRSRLPLSSDLPAVTSFRKQMWTPNIPAEVVGGVFSSSGLVPPVTPAYIRHFCRPPFFSYPNIRRSCSEYRLTASNNKPQMLWHFSTCSQCYRPLYVEFGNYRSSQTAFINDNNNNNNSPLMGEKGLVEEDWNDRHNWRKDNIINK